MPIMCAFECMCMCIYATQFSNYLDIYLEYHHANSPETLLEEAYKIKYKNVKH